MFTTPEGSYRSSAAGRFVCHDIDEATRQFGDRGLKISIRPLNQTSGRIDATLAGMAPDDMIFAHTRFEQPVEIMREPLNAYQLVIPVRGLTTIDLGGRVLSCDSPAAMVFNMRDMKTITRSADSEIYAVIVAHRVLTRRLFEITGAPVLRKLVFQREPQISEAGVLALRSVTETLETALLAPEIRAAQHSMCRLSGLIVDLMLELLPHNYRDALTRKTRLIAPEHVKRTVEFIQRNTGRLLTTEELVPVSGVSLRTLQYGFDRFLGLSISDYERSVRLERARQDIERNPRERVAIVAKRWSFSNFTRFNTQFKEAYGLSAVELRANCLASAEITEFE